MIHNNFFIKWILKVKNCQNYFITSLKIFNIIYISSFSSIYGIKQSMVRSSFRMCILRSENESKDEIF